MTIDSFSDVFNGKVGGLKKSDEDMSYEQQKKEITAQKKSSELFGDYVKGLDKHELSHIFPKRLTKKNKKVTNSLNEYFDNDKKKNNNLKEYFNDTKSKKNINVNNYLKMGGKMKTKKLNKVLDKPNNKVNMMLGTTNNKGYMMSGASTKSNKVNMMLG